MEPKITETKKQKLRSVSGKNNVKNGVYEVCKSSVEVDHKGIDY